MSRGQYRKVGKTYIIGKCTICFGYYWEPLNATRHQLEKKTRREGKKSVKIFEKSVDKQKIRCYNRFRKRGKKYGKDNS